MNFIEFDIERPIVGVRLYALLAAGIALLTLGVVSLNLALVA